MSLDWYFHRAGQQVGPLSLARLGEMIREGTLRPEDYVWSQSLANWQQVASVPELLAAAAPAPAPNPMTGFASSLNLAASSFFSPAVQPAAAVPAVATTSSHFPASTDDYLVNLHFFMAPTSGIEWLFESIDTDTFKIHLDGRMAGEATYRDGFNFYWQIAPGNHLAEIVLWDRKERDRKKFVLRVPQPGNYQIRFNLVKSKSKIRESTIDVLAQP